MTNDSPVPEAGQPSGGVSFAMVDAAIFRDPTLPPHVKLVYVALAGYASKQRTAFPSHARLATDCNLSARAVGKAIKVGAEAGLWTITHTQSSNRYEIHDLGGSYVLGSGPHGTTCHPGEQEVPSGEARGADELDQRTRPATQTHIASSSGHTPVGHTSPSVRLGQRSASTARIIRTPRGFYDPTKYPDKKVWPYLVSAVVAALENDGMEMNRHAPDEIGYTLKHKYGHLPRKQLVAAVREWTRAAGDPDHPAGWIAHRKAS